MKFALGLALTFWFVAMAALWNHNLPTWCATPEVGHNALVQPFCSKE